MQGRFEFDGAEVRALLEESRAARERLWTEAQRYVAAGVDLRSEPVDLESEPELPETGAPPGLWLMNDEGIYLRSNAPDGGDRIAHARGFRAEVRVGDDEMCEFIDAAPLDQLLPGDTLVVTVGEEKIGLSILRET